jgi:hypothetical protein
MKAVRCQSCKLLVAPGDYGNLIVAAASNHLAREEERGSGIAMDCCHSSAGICAGSEMLGPVETIEGPKGEKPLSS